MLLGETESVGRRQQRGRSMASTSSACRVDSGPHNAVADGRKCPEFLETVDFHRVQVGSRKARVHRALLNPSSRYHRTLTCDRQTADAHTAAFSFRYSRVKKLLKLQKNV